MKLLEVRCCRECRYCDIDLDYNLWHDACIHDEDKIRIIDVDADEGCASFCPLPDAEKK